ncbi:MAG TPA: nuclear transport factor 2 family protein [Geodermatophilus sp.]|nr:nuclear transport factor 2 family protein [Geodermatophilus sp.]
MHPDQVDHRPGTGDPAEIGQRVRDVMVAMSQGRVGLLFDAMAEDVTWRWMGVDQWSRTFEGKQTVIDTLFGGATDTLGPSSSVEVLGMHADGDCVVVEHSGHNELPDGRRYDNNYCWVLQFRGGFIHEVREYMDTQLVTDTFGAEAAP